MRVSGGFALVDCVLTAVVDVRRGDVLEQASAPTGSGLSDDDEVILAAIEMLRCGERPSQLLLLGAEHVHLYRRSPTDPNLAALAIARRTANLGLVLAELRARLDEVTP